MKKTLATFVLCGFFVLFYISSASALVVLEVEPNDTFTNAQNIDSFFSLGSNPDIGNSTTVPWVSITGTGNGTRDYYFFTVPDPGMGFFITGVFDVDYAYPGFDSTLRLFTSLGANPALNFDYSPIDPGSSDPHDSYLTYAFSGGNGIGSFEIEVSSGSSADGVTAPYELQVSIPGHSLAEVNGLPEPATMLLLGLGLIGLAGIRRKFYNLDN